MLHVGEERSDHLGWVLPCHSPAGEENFQGNISSFFVSLAKGETQGFYPSLSRSILEVVVVVFCLFVCLGGWVGVLLFCFVLGSWFFRIEFLCGALAVWGLTW